KYNGAITSTPQIPATTKTIFANFILPPTPRGVFPSPTARACYPRASPRRFRPLEWAWPPRAAHPAPASARTSDTPARNPRDSQSGRGIAPPPRLCLPLSGIPMPGRTAKTHPQDSVRRILPIFGGGSSVGQSWWRLVLYVEVRPAQTPSASKAPALSPLG